VAIGNLAPWPGFEPGSGGRQPPILDRTILPGLLHVYFARKLEKNVSVDLIFRLIRMRGSEANGLLHGLTKMEEAES
jgi:hypothetical protein